jgi:precorrin-4 C11-methyltransferase
LFRFAYGIGHSNLAENINGQVTSKNKCMEQQTDIKIAIVLTSEIHYPLALEIKKNLNSSQIYTKANIEDTQQVSSINECLEEIYHQVESLIFIDAMGVCIRSIASFVKGDESDPAVVCVDSNCKYVVSVISGYQGGASILTKRVAHILGAEAIITSQTDNINLWALETLGDRFGWSVDTNSASLNYPQTSFINKKPTALLLDIVDEGTTFMERTAPQHVKVFYKYEDIDIRDFELLIAVSPKVFPEAGIQIIYYHPKVLHIGVSCRRYADSAKIADALTAEIEGLNFSMSSIKSISSVEDKEDDKLLSELHTHFHSIPTHVYTTRDLEELQFLNTSDQSEDSITVASISEATALKSSGMGKIVIHKQKAVTSPPPNDFTFAIALDRNSLRQGHIEIVGGGPGDPDLISVKGRYVLEAADLILYSESQTPPEATYFAKDGAVVKNTDSMIIKDIQNVIREYYNKGKLIVGLYSGDPSMHDTIFEQLDFFERHNMSYHITPGISTFFAAAASLESQLTIADEVDTLIFTRGNKNSSMLPEQRLEALSQSKSTMCLALKPEDAELVQKSLLIHYAPDTPIAVCYKLTLKDEYIHRGELKDLARIVSWRSSTLSSMVIIGSAIGRRKKTVQQITNKFDYLFGK